ncbi:zinc finger protein OZF isoform X22 [Tribolium castaneum]|uniref:zinc finger protein OZF isoform X22 n=1 Tax=Tribolium castaneum TaxID=7070 RepID=UPI00077DEC31|nr:PREDICTED: zinc finger protein OZF isoform X24 [Tribolium castaneum]|eukprot:XP_015834140.1 PREDICTED: zinc finger protein OZF isoform X24 [Tribolium castaneum]
MGSIENISELCRLCLVKDQVNVPIFEENATKEQTFVKINSCLPVKVSRDDSLPKKICDGCSCKLDMLYTFRNTSVDSEKQLLKWLNQAGLSCSQSAVKDPLASTKPEVTIKQETFEPTDSRDDLGLDTHSYIMQQQKLPYSQEFEFGEPSESNVGLMTDEPAPKKAKRAAALNKASVETDEDDLDAAMQITKAEDEDSDEIDQPEYVEAPSTSADDQPGPSGVNKTTVEAPGIPYSDEVLGNAFECTICSKRFLTKRKLGKHILRHREKKHKCPLCDRKFISPSEIKTHILYRHDKRKQYFCDHCTFGAPDNFTVKQHTIIHHTRDFPFKCDECTKGFISRQNLAQHKKVDHEGVEFVCDLCSKRFKSQANLRRHVAKHDPDYTAPSFPCEVCGKVLGKKASLEYHLKTHKGEASNYVCHLCGKSVTSSMSLKYHMDRHAGKRSFVCEVCGKAFTTKVLLTTHSRVHTKEKPFKCTECDKAFSQKGTLNIHKRYHTGERPYKCEFCDKAFVSKTALNGHKCRALYE